MVTIKMREYVLKTFGVELHEPKLTDDEQILLCKIREARNQASRISGKKRKKGEEFDIDEELSNLCTEQWR